jgi:hypothetical protein
LEACKAEIARLAQARKELVALAAQDDNARARLAALTEASVKAQIEADNARMTAEVAAEAERKQARAIEEARQRDVVKRARTMRAELVKKTEEADATFAAWIEKTVESQAMADELAGLLKTELGVSVSVGGFVEVVLRDGGRSATQLSGKQREARADGFRLGRNQVVQLDRQLSQSADWVHASRFAG